MARSIITARSPRADPLRCASALPLPAPTTFPDHTGARLAPLDLRREQGRRPRMEATGPPICSCANPGLRATDASMVTVHLTRHLYSFFPQLEGKEITVEASTVGEVVRALEAL